MATNSESRMPAFYSWIWDRPSSSTLPLRPAGPPQEGPGKLGKGTLRLVSSCEPDTGRLTDRGSPPIMGRNLKGVSNKRIQSIMLNLFSTKEGGSFSYFKGHLMVACDELVYTEENISQTEHQDIVSMRDHIQALVTARHITLVQRRLDTNKWDYMAIVLPRRRIK